MSERSVCGLHVTYRYPCPHCARANAANEAALADVIPKGDARKGQHMTDADVARIQQMHADGTAVYLIAEQERRDPKSIKAALEGHYMTLEKRRKQHGTYGLPVPGASARSMATIPTQRART